MFYCDPMQSGQKGTLENKHIELRYILPKGTDLKALGLHGQDDLNLVLSHVDSAPVGTAGAGRALWNSRILCIMIFMKSCMPSASGRSIKTR